MKRKLSNSESSNLSGNDVQDDVAKQVQSSSSLEQITDSSEECVRLTPSLALALGMNPGEALVRGMFHNTPMASVVSDLVDKMLKAHGDLVLGGVTIPGLGDDLDEDDFIRSNERLIEALMDSAEAPDVVQMDGADTRGQSSSAQGHGSATLGAGVGFVLEPHLALSLGMNPGEALFRGMFHGTPQVSRVSALVAQLLNRQEVLLRHGTGEGTSSATQRSATEVADLIESNAITIRALMDSTEEPTFTAVPELHGHVQDSPEAVVEVSTNNQVPISAPEQSFTSSEEGFMLLAPDLASALGMTPGERLLRGMFYGTQRSNVVLEIVGQLLALREDLLRSQALEEANVAIQEGIGLDCETTAVLIATNEKLLQALVASIEEPSFTALSTVTVIDSEEESVKRLEEERSVKTGNENILIMAEEELANVERRRQKDKKIKEAGKIKKKRAKAEEKSEIMRKEPAEEIKALMDRVGAPTATIVSSTLVPIASETESVTESEEGGNQRLTRSESIPEREEQKEETEMDLSTAKLRAANLKEVKNVVRVGTIKPKVATLSNLREINRELRAVEDKKKKIRSVLETGSSNAQEMRIELEKVRSRKRKIGIIRAGENAVDIEEVRAKQLEIELELERVRKKAGEVGSLEQKLDTLLAKKVELEIKGASVKEINKVKTSQMKVDARLVESRAMVERARELGIELDRLIERELFLERRVSTGEEVNPELSRLSGIAEAEESEEKIDLELELARVRVREIELELSIELESLVAMEIELKEARRIVKNREKELKKKLCKDPEKLKRKEIAKKIRETRAEIEAAEEKKAKAEKRQREIETKQRKKLEEGAARKKSKMEEAKRMKALLGERSAKMRRELAEEKEIEMKIRLLELELEEARKSEKSGKIEEEKVEGITELELELAGVITREQDLSTELNRVRTRATNLCREIRAGRVISGATASEIEEKKSKLKGLSRSRSLERITEIKLEIELSKARVRARRLVLKLDKLRAREQGQD
ncbi:hypothetical protein [Candidatus Ichthyocystis sparus]|uniref:hypothetical protein n=1 Tax=Candidatus Ichthyocystis sparus TaxID=1561004 RepID=UPI000B803ECE|nr:hypothetical protein [Candidatus Ichthyocystis sparus]